MPEAIRSPWRITSTAGGAVTLGSEGLAVSVGVGSLNLRVSNSATGGTATVHGVGAGVGVGANVAPPVPFFPLLRVSMDGSTYDFPSGGIGPILNLKIDRTALLLEDLAGTMVAYTGVCKGLGGGSISAIVFVRATLLERALPFLNPTSIKAVGFYAGTLAGTTLGLDANAYIYYNYAE